MEFPSSTHIHYFFDMGFKWGVKRCIAGRDIYKIALGLLIMNSTFHSISGEAEPLNFKYLEKESSYSKRTMIYTLSLNFEILCYFSLDLHCHLYIWFPWDIVQANTIFIRQKSELPRLPLTHSSNYFVTLTLIVSTISHELGKIYLLVLY